MGRQLFHLLVCEYPAVNKKTDAKRYFEGEAATAAGGGVERQLRVLPVFELVPAHKKGAVMDDAEEHVAVASPELVLPEAHRLRAIAATAAEVEHEGAMCLP